MHRTAERRADVRAVMPSARSVISLGVVYNADRPYSTENADPAVAAIARYAWGDDYHVEIGERLSDARRDAPRGGGRLVRSPRLCRHRTGAGAGVRAVRGARMDRQEHVPDQPGARLMDLPGRDSSPTSRSSPTRPRLDQCGTCTLCLEACPTGALVEPRVLDSTRCLSYLTIELKGAIPVEHRDAVAEHAYGCDICQEVCPWNLSPSTGVTAHRAWQPRERARRSDAARFVAPIGRRAAGAAERQPDEARGSQAAAAQPRGRDWQQRRPHGSRRAAQPRGAHVSRASGGRAHRVGGGEARWLRSALREIAAQVSTASEVRRQPEHFG